MDGVLSSCRFACRSRCGQVAGSGREAAILQGQMELPSTCATDLLARPGTPVARTRQRAPLHPTGTMRRELGAPRFSCGV